MSNEQRKTGPTKGYEHYPLTFLANRFPSSRNGKVVYIRPGYHERLLRIVQLIRGRKDYAVFLY